MSTVNEGNIKSVDNRTAVSRASRTRVLKRLAPFISVGVMLGSFWLFVFSSVALPFQVSLLALLFSVPFILSAWALWYFTDETGVTKS